MRLTDICVRTSSARIRPGIRGVANGTPGGCERPSVVNDDGEEGRVDLEAAVVFDEAKLLELVHEEVHAGPRRPDHFGERLLRYSRQQPLRMILISVAREQQQRA